MDNIAIIKALADGIDPFSGEVLPEDHLLQNHQVVRALFHALQSLEKTGAIKDKKIKSNSNAGGRWSLNEDNDLIREFDEKMSINSIAKIHNRSIGAISSRLIKLGKIDIHSHQPISGNVMESSDLDVPLAN